MRIVSIIPELRDMPEHVMYKAYKKSLVYASIDEVDVSEIRYGESDKVIGYIITENNGNPCAAGDIVSYFDENGNEIEME